MAGDGGATDLWPWLGLMGLGAFHGLNPAMGWLFSVALGLQHKSRARVLWSLLPIAAGHAVSIAGVVGLVAVVRRVVDLDALRWTAAAILIAFGLYRLAVPHKSPAGGMQVGFADLTVWENLDVAAAEAFGPRDDSIPSVYRVARAKGIVRVILEVGPE